MKWILASDFKWESHRVYYAKRILPEIKSSGRFMDNGDFYFDRAGYSPVIKSNHDQLFIMDESEQDEGWSFDEDQVKDAMKYAADNNLLFTKTDEQIDRLYDNWLKTIYPKPPVTKD